MPEDVMIETMHEHFESGHQAGYDTAVDEIRELFEGCDDEDLQLHTYITAWLTKNGAL